MADAGTAISVGHPDLAAAEPGRGWLELSCRALKAGLGMFGSESRLPLPGRLGTEAQASASPLGAGPDVRANEWPPLGPRPSPASGAAAFAEHPTAPRPGPGPHEHRTRAGECALHPRASALEGLQPVP